MTVRCAHSVVCSSGEVGKGRVLVCAVGDMEARLIGRELLSGEDRVCKHSINQSFGSDKSPALGDGGGRQLQRWSIQGVA